MPSKKGLNPGKDPIPERIERMKALTHNELISFSRQLSMLLRSGISVTEGLYLMAGDLPQGRGRTLLNGLSRELEQSGRLAEAMESSGVFPDYMISMTDIGEQTGRLDDVMASLAGHYEREARMTRSIKSAVAYPLAMIAMMVIVIVILLVRVMPIFRQVFELLGLQMEGVSGALMNVSAILSRYGAIIFILLLVLAAAFLILFFTPKGRRGLTVFLQRFVLTRGITRQIACSRFAGGMYLCLASGLDMDQSLDMAVRLVNHPRVLEQIDVLRRDTAGGQSFSEAIGHAQIFPGIYNRMLAIGSRAGVSDEVMKQISEGCLENIEDSLDRIVSRLEPTLVAVLSVSVGMILLSAMLPLMGIMTSLG